jgi:hypothetical protein
MHLSARKPGRYRLVFLPLLAALAAAGCSGSSSGTVTGQVLYMGKPVKGGSVTFVSTEGKRAVSVQIKEDGTYKMEKVPAGNVRICVDTETLNPEKQARRPTYSAPKDAKLPEGYNTGGQADAARLYVKIPPQYADPERTSLTYTVTGGSQEYDIPLK